MLATFYVLTMESAFVFATSLPQFVRNLTVVDGRFSSGLSLTVGYDVAMFWRELSVWPLA